MQCHLLYKNIVISYTKNSEEIACRYKMKLQTVEPQVQPFAQSLHQEIEKRNKIIGEFVY